MNQKKVSINGLQNIGKLLGRAEAPQEAPKRERRTLNGIFNHTREKIEAATGLSPDGRPQTDDFRAKRELLKTYINASIREAHALGHAEALEQNSSVERLLEKQYEARTRVTAPAVVCAIMEQSGLSSMTLDMAQMATVFQRCDIDYVYNPDTEIMEYTMRPAGVSTDDPLAVPFTDVEDDVRHQVEDIEQAQRDPRDIGSHEDESLT